MAERVAGGRLGDAGARTASFTARWRTDSWRWWRRRWPVSRSSRSAWPGRPTARPTPGRRSGTCGPGRRAARPSRRRAKVGLVLLAHALEVGGQRGSTAAGSMVIRSLRPLPSRTRSGSPRSRRPSRAAAALQQAKARAVEQDSHEPWHAVEALRTARTSSRVRTTGRCWGRLARTTSSSHGSSTPSTSRRGTAVRERLVLGGRGDLSWTARRSGRR